MLPLHSKLTVIGAGPGGYTAAIYASRAGLEPILLEGLIPGGPLRVSYGVDNFPGYSQGIQRPELKEEMRKQAKGFGTIIMESKAEKIDLLNRPFTIE